jgi:hypothetical protein
VVTFSSIMNAADADAQAVRDEVRALRRQGAVVPLPMGVVFVVALVLAIVEGNPTGFGWATFLVAGVPMWVVATRWSRDRDAEVLAKGDAPALAYLRGRLGYRIKLPQWTIPVFLAFIALLVGAFFLLCVLVSNGEDRLPMRPLLAGELLLVGGTLLATTAWHCLATLPARSRRLAELGGPLSFSPPPDWLLEVAGELHDRGGREHAVALWAETTGLSVRAARRAVRELSAADRGS